MSEVVLEISNPDDLQLLLSFAKRLNVRILSVSGLKKNSNVVSDPRLILLRQAANDPLFQSDVEEVLEDFSHADNEAP